jgi:hypothetical protein
MLVLPRPPPPSELPTETPARQAGNEPPAVVGPRHLATIRFSLCRRLRAGRQRVVGERSSAKRRYLA